jgi:glycosyltransferase involved in cell wall biosynthesis
MLTRNMTDTGIKLKTKPAVSIGMPVFNGEGYIREALDSVLAQTFGDFELIISDNCSTDRTHSICLEYCALDSRIRYIQQATNISVYKNFAYVLDNARGELFTWLAHDDALGPRFLEKSTEYMRGHTNTTIVSGDFAIIDGTGTKVDVVTLDSIREFYGWEKRQLEFFKYPISNVYFCIYGLLRTEACRSIMHSLPAQRFATGTELPILARLATIGEITSIPEVLRIYRRHDQSVYMLEAAETVKQAFIHRLAISIVRVNRLRIDQLYVLIKCDMPLVRKLVCVFKLSLFYAAHSFHTAVRIVRIPHRFLTNPSRE